MIKPPPSADLIDASLLLARSNPDLVRYASEQARELRVPVDDLLRSAIARVAAARRRTAVRTGVAFTPKLVR